MRCVRNESACCKTKVDSRRRRATSVPFARCRDSSKFISDPHSTCLLASSLIDEDMHILNDVRVNDGEIE